LRIRAAPFILPHCLLTFAGGVHLDTFEAWLPEAIRSALS
jgi:hypothetical protein